MLGRDDPLLNFGSCWSGDRGAVSLSGPVGVGKTALSRAFLHRLLASRALRGAKAFGWSADGTRGGAGRFLRALGGFLEIAEAGRAPLAELAEDLAARLAETPVLILLDGVESLAHAPHIRGGRLKDPALSALLSRIAEGGETMALAVGRQPLAEAPEERRFRLQGLAPEQGAALLRAAGILGEPERLQAASEALRGNPLALRRLARLIRRRAAAEGLAPAIALRDRLPPDGLLRDGAADPIDPEARRAAAALESDLDRIESLPSRAAGRGAPERSLMALAGLDLSGLDEAALQALSADPPIEALTEPLATASERSARAREEFARRRLAALGLIAESAEGEPPTLRAEPLAGAAARARLAARAPEALRQAERRLYDHHRAGAPSHPETRAEAAPLLAAIAHGAAGSERSRAFLKVFRAQLWDRALRGESRFAVARLGAVEEVLAALAGFFATLWTVPDPRLEPLDQARALGLAGFCLRGAARLREAEQALALATARYDALGRREDAARAETERAEALIALGRAEAAEEAAMSALDHAERLSDVADRRVVALSAAAGAALLAGAGALALRRLREAERAQQARAEAGLSDRPRLYSLAGRRYAAALLETGDREGAARRAAGLMVAAEEDRLPLARGLAALTLAEIAAGDPRGAAREARARFDQAVEEIEASGRRDALPEALLARARFLAEAGGEADLRRARRDAERALALAEAAEMAPALAAARDRLAALGADRPRRRSA